MEEGKKVQPVYTEEFKRDAVSLFESGSRPLVHVARELGVSASALRVWVLAKGSSSRSVSGSFEEENRRIRKEIAELRMEKEILKRFSAFWVKETNGK